MTDLSNKERLEDDIIRSIRQFQKYAELSPLERNNFVVFILEKLLEEAKKMQLYESRLTSMEK